MGWEVTQIERILHSWRGLNSIGLRTRCFQTSANQRLLARFGHSQSFRPREGGRQRLCKLTSRRWFNTAATAELLARSYRTLRLFKYPAAGSQRLWNPDQFDSHDIARRLAAGSEHVYQAGRGSTQTRPLAGCRLQRLPGFAPAVKTDFPLGGGLKENRTLSVFVHTLCSLIDTEGNARSLRLSGSH